MNSLVAISGVLAAFAVIGHFTVGSKSYLKPMLKSSFDRIPKRVMLCVFHYISTFLVLSAIFLLLTGFGYNFKSDPSLLIKFIALNYLVFAVVQIFYALTSDIKNGIFKLFQWVFFVLIALFAWFGV